MFRICQTIIRNNNKQIRLNNELKRCLATSTQSKHNKDEQHTTGAKKQEATNNEKRPNMSFMSNIFRGEMETSQVFPYPYAINEEQREFLSMFVDSTTKFFTEVNDPAKNDANETVDEATVNALWELGAFGLQVPLEYGGLGASNTQLARMGEVVGTHDLGVGVLIGAHQSIGYKGILLYGTPEQKNKYIEACAIGKTYAAFCLTEPSAGSDASSIKSRAVLTPDGKHFILNGSKIYISNGGIANVLTVFAQTEVDDPKTGKKRDKVTAFIVERGFGGVVSGPPEQKMGIKGSNTTEIFFEDCKIPIENVLGNVGDGFKVAMNILNNGRFGMGATLCGTMATCIRKAAEHATNRVQFGKKLQDYKGVHEKLAKMAMLQYATQSMAYMIASNMDKGSQDYHLEAAISKVFASDSAFKVCDDAIQLLGGMGYMKACGLEKFLRDIRVFRIFEGANDILKLFVALTGIQYAGSHLKELQIAFKNPAANLGLIFKEVSSRAIRSVGFGGSDLTPFVDPSLRDSAKLCAECIDVFGKTVESLLIKYGKNIVDEQYMLNNLAECAINIYTMVAVVSRATRSISTGLNSADHERLMAQGWCIHAHESFQIHDKRIHSPVHSELYGKMSSISKNICDSQGVASINPVNV